jgi:hypothetical protein
MTTLNSFLTKNWVDSAKESIKAYTELINPDADQVKSYPLFLTQPQIYSSKTHTPYIGVNPISSQVVSSGFYKDLNKDKSVQKTLTKYYYYKILDKWIYKELMPILGFVDISGDKSQLIKSLDQYNASKLANDSTEQIEKRIAYLEKVLITKDMVRHVLKKICTENNINWYDLDKNEKKIKTVFHNYLLDKLKESIKKYSKKLE